MKTNFSFSHLLTGRVIFPEHIYIDVDDLLSFDTNNNNNNNNRRTTNRRGVLTDSAAEYKRSRLNDSDR